jgi:putative NIF3 family GTP cyclohydrolase 1 type 2
MNKQVSSSLYPGVMERKTFLVQSLKAMGGLALLFTPSGELLTSNSPIQKEYTVQEMMDSIMKEVPGAPFKQTVDTLKSGRPDQKVTGIITTMFATIPVIEQARLGNANFIIAHEPTYYNHEDNKNWVSNNKVQQQKQALLEKYQIAVWRFHDYCHRLQPDAISYGVVKKAGWSSYYKPGNTILDIPAISLGKLIEQLKLSLGIAHVRVIGNMEQLCQRVALLPGAWGGTMQVGTAELQKPDVLIVGELQEWETAEYIRDAQSFGKPISLIVLGHAQSEEPGMEWVAAWLQPKFPGISIKHIASGSPFTWV